MVITVKELVNRGEISAEEAGFSGIVGPWQESCGLCEVEEWQS